VLGLEKVDEIFYTSPTKAVRRCNEIMKMELQDLKTACFTILPKLVENGLQHVFEKWMGRC
jgi:hypothetical protein